MAQVADLLALGQELQFEPTERTAPEAQSLAQVTALSDEPEVPLPSEQEEAVRALTDIFNLL